MPLFHSILSTLMASNALEMESELLAEARDHDELFVDDFYEAATDNEESDVSEFSSHDGRDTDGDAGIDAPLVAPVDNAPLAAPVEPPAAPILDGAGAAAQADAEAAEGAGDEKTKRFEQMRKNFHRGQGSKNTLGKRTRVDPPVRVKR